MSDARLRTGMVWNLVPVVVLGVVGLGMNFAIGRWWGTSALGVFNQVTTAYFVLASIGAIGINLSVLRAIAQQPSDGPRVAAIVIGAVLPATVLAIAVTGLMLVSRGALGRWLDSPEVTEGIVYVTPGLACFVVNKTLLSIVNGLGRMRAFAMYTTLRYTMIGVALIIAGVLELDAIHLPIIWTITECTLFVVLVVEILATVKLSSGAGWRPWIVEHLRFGIRGAGATMLFEINSRLDIWLLGAVVSDSNVGIYSMAASLAEGASQIPNALQVNVNPTIAAALATGRTDEVEALARRTRKWFVPAMIAVCGLAVVLFPLVIPWITDRPELAEGSLPFALLIGGLALTSAWLPFNQLLLMGGKPGWHTVYVLLTVALNVVLNVLLIPHYGLTGAALATAIALGGSAILLMRMSRRLVGVRI